MLTMFALTIFTDCLLQQVKDPVIVAQFDAVVVHADNSAIDFFGKFGFTDDVVLNSKWRWVFTLYNVQKNK